jgi:hypothetical protein
LPVSKAWVEWRLQDAAWVATARSRLRSLSWFMKCLKEPLARLANRQDKARGAFFEERFKSVDDAPGESVARLVSGLHPPCPPFARGGNGAGSARFRITTMYTLIWLCPIEDRRGLDSPREGMLGGLSLGSYLLLVDFTGRLFREGKAGISAELAGIFERLGSDSERWWSRIEKLGTGRLLGRFFAASRERLRDVAAHLGVRHLANLGGCTAR